MSTIIPFLNRKVFFITGATGFLGKGLVEKLLRHAPDIGRIYLMVRPRSRGTGKPISADDRLQREILESSAFARLRAELGDRFDEVMREKLVAIPSDLTHDRLGIDAETYARLTSEVDIVINSAAKVTFDEPLDQALAQNTLGPKRVVEFAQACRDAILVHLSTAYVNGRQKGAIAETAPVPDQTVAQLMDNEHPPDYDLESEIEAIQEFCREIDEASHKPERDVEFNRFLDRQDKGKRITPHRREHQIDALRQRWRRERLVARGMKRGRELGWHDSYSFTKAMGEQMVAKTRGDLPTVIIRPSIIESSLSDPEPGW
ncbi:MAG: SDR family oxidoreductase, partial [Candidatus Latescibacteria bacterium]|nr:SDR family oxidoreductase [Candidatus Latescibacterota bacterium]